MLIASHSAGFVPDSSTPTRYTLETTFTPPSKGTYEIEIYNYRNASQTSVWNFIDNISAAPADPDFHNLQNGISGSQGGTMYFQVKMGYQYSGTPYLVLFAEGIHTGFSLDGFDIALNYDGIFQYSLANINSGPFTDNFGTLDGLGRAACQLSLGPNPANIGRIFYAQACLLTPPGTRPITHVTNPALFEILP